MDQFEFRIKIPFSPKAKFGLKAVLVLILVLAVGLGAFKYGRESGLTIGYQQGYETGWDDSQQAKLVKQSYPVSDLVIELGSPPNFDRLIDQIQQSVEPKSWQANGGPATLAPYPMNLSLVVNQTHRGHKAIEEYLDAQRSGKAGQTK